MKQKSVIISEECHEHLKRISERLGRPIGKVAEQSILYISKKHIDPANLKEGNPIGEIKKYHDHTIAYITTFEKTKLQPLLDNLTIVFSSIQKAVSRFSQVDIPTQTNGTNQRELAELKSLLMAIENRLVNQNHSHQKALDTNQFKNQFMENQNRILKYVNLFSKEIDDLARAPLVSNEKIRRIKGNFVAQVKPLLKYEH
ncbi:BfmA/BtgA family mobilization protein [Cytophagales bacterium LB-30]|uniref:BfmA/BtgA family mobilization protein n=1 Tax=Shiella aurantiaca TaxID=3058365 RepID=A0ABT8F9D2_9BACT|nr:BfmA/BtgA family mobilization protein [Shiella aurantiaca]MDN4167042.1 BfmA/BtgA family mobilization protein [Shiella aurantiaca]